MGLLMTIDNGGTFTDACLIGENKVISAKTLTTPYDLTKCFIEVIREASKKLYGEEDIHTLLTEINYLRYSTTAGTNAMVEKTGSRLGLIISNEFHVDNLKGTEDEKVLFENMVEDRIATVNVSDSDNNLENDIVDAVNQLISQGANRIVVSLTEPNLIADESKVKNIILRKYPRHLLGAVPILISHELSDDADDVRRTWGGLINSYLHAGMEQFLYNAENTLRSHRTKNPLLIFQNDGNSARVAKSTAIKTYGSGPRGGMEGTLALAKHYDLPGIVTLDIGGTTSDIGLVSKHNIKEEMYGKIEGIETPFSLSELTSVGVGGSSVFKVKDGKITVGPESVGAAPGPACFGRGGEEATITDVYLLMGVLDSRSYFRGTMVLDEQRAKATIEKNICEPLGINLNKALELMEEAYVSKISDSLEQFQNQLSDVTLLAFGGAGPMSACSVAESANIDSVIIPRLAAIFSAFGISFSDIAHEYQATIVDVSEETIKEKTEELMEHAKRDMFAEGYSLSECNVYSNLHYMIDGEYKSINENEFSQVDEINEADEIRLHLKVERPIEHYELQNETKLNEIEPVSIYEKDIFQSGNKMPVYRFEDMEPGTTGIGPALIEDEYFTTRVLPNWKFNINENKDILLSNEGRK